MVTFWVRVRPEAESRAESGAEARAESLETRIEIGLAPKPLTKAELARVLGLPGVTGQLNRAVRALVERGQVVLTIPEKPNSRMQKYRIS